MTPPPPPTKNPQSKSISKPILKPNSKPNAKPNQNQVLNQSQPRTQPQIKNQNQTRNQNSRQSCIDVYGARKVFMTHPKFFGAIDPDPQQHVALTTWDPWLNTLNNTSNIPPKKTPLRKRMATTASKQKQRPLCKRMGEVLSKTYTLHNEKYRTCVYYLKIASFTCTMCGRQFSVLEAI